MNKQDSSSLENYDSRPSHKASDKIWVDPSGSILMAAFCLNRHSPHVQNNLENSFWLLSCDPASPVCFGLWSVTQRKETHVAPRLHTEEGDTRGMQVARGGRRCTWHAGCPHLWARMRPGCATALLGTWNSPSVPTRWYTAAGESWILGRTPSSTLTYQLWRVTWKECAVHLMGVTGVQITFGKPSTEPSLCLFHLFKLGIPAWDLWQP